MDPYIFKLYRIDTEWKNHKFELKLFLVRFFVYLLLYIKIELGDNFLVVFLIIYMNQ